MNSRLQTVIYAGIALAALIAGGVGLYVSLDDSESSNENSSSENNFSVTVEVISDQEILQINTNSFEEQSAFDLLTSLAEASSEFSFEYDSFDFGPFITKINNLEPNENQFIEFRVNGAQASVGVGDYEMQSGDTISFEVVDVEELSL